jgi:hypothetical protein
MGTVAHLKKAARLKDSTLFTKLFADMTTRKELEKQMAV